VNEPDDHQVTLREWFRLPKAERTAARDTFRGALHDLWFNSEVQCRQGIDYETDTYHALNDRVNDLWGTVPRIVHFWEYSNARDFSELLDGDEAE